MSDPEAVFVITGVMASGKSTVTELLAKSFQRGVHVRGDAFRKMVVSGRAEMTSDESEEAIRQLRLRYSLAASTADAYFDAGFTVVVQDVILGPMMREFRDMIRSRPLHVIALAPSPEVVAERETQRSKTGYGGGWTPQNLDRSLRRETPGVEFWIDSSDQTPEETVQEILRLTLNV